MDLPKRKAFSKKLREAVYDKYHGHCAYCGISIEYKQMQVDHLEPVSLYPIDEVNRVDNLMPSCRSCNNYKHSLTIEMFRRALENQPTTLMRDNSTYRIATRFGTVTHNPKKIVFYFEELIDDRIDVIGNIHDNNKENGL